MTNEQILKKAIEKAVKNGYQKKYIRDWFGLNFGRGEKYKYQYLYFAIIFSHDFAKAFFKDEEHSCEFCGVEECCEATKEPWRENLAVMVLQEDPIKYLEKFL